MAVAAGADPVEFRLRYLREERDAEVLRAAAERYGWKPAVPGPANRPGAGAVTGRGVAYTRRGSTVVAVIAEVEVNLDSGRVWPRRFVVASDQGIVVNPLWLRRTIEGNIIHATSRALHEEVRFTPERVTSVDWISYPILEMNDAPETSTSCSSTGRTCRPTAPGSLRREPCRPRSPTRYSTRQDCVFAGRRLRRSESSRHSAATPARSRVSRSNRVLDFLGRVGGTPHLDQYQALGSDSSVFCRPRKPRIWIRSALYVTNSWLKMAPNMPTTAPSMSSRNACM